MGRQVNFYMSREDEREFVDFVRSTANVEILPYTSATREFTPVQTLPEPLSMKFWGELWLVNRSISSNLVVNFISQQGYYTIDGLQSSVIEFSRSFLQEGVLKPGRIWAEFNVFDGGRMILLPKESGLEEWYDAIAKWIRKRYKRVSSSFYAAPGAMRFRQDGGKLDEDMPPSRGETEFIVKDV